MTDQQGGDCGGGWVVEIDVTFFSWRIGFICVSGVIADNILFALQHVQRVKL
jgi:hypothetical protein